MDPSDSLNATAVSAALSSRLLRHWHWLIPPEFVIVCVTRLGDAFLRDPHGSIWWLDVGQGTLELVAADQRHWVARIADPDTLDYWSARVLVARLASEGLIAGAAQCFTYLLCPPLGGSYEPSNFKVVSLVAHFDIWGPIHEQLQGLPDGTHVVFHVGPDPSGTA